jgi:hypothetical protein
MAAAVDRYTMCCTRVLRIVVQAVRSRKVSQRSVTSVVHVVGTMAGVDSS